MPLLNLHPRLPKIPFGRRDARAPCVVQLRHEPGEFTLEHVQVAQGTDAPGLAKSVLQRLEGICKSRDRRKVFVEIQRFEGRGNDTRKERRDGGDPLPVLEEG